MTRTAQAAPRLEVKKLRRFCLLIVRLLLSPSWDAGSIRGRLRSGPGGQALRIIESEGKIYRSFSAARHTGEYEKRRN
ncbi:MAG: hypothetical protein Kow00109_07000 [Acidobacteriota bacterium]